MQKKSQIRYKQQVEYLNKLGVKIGDKVKVERYFYSDENTFFIAEIVCCIENEKNQLTFGGFLSDEPIMFLLLENCSKNWLKKGHITKIEGIRKIELL